MTGKLAGLRAELGLCGAAFYLLDRLLDRCSGGHARLIRYAIVAQPLGPGAPRPPLRDDGKTTFHDVSAGHPLVASFPRPAAVLARRFDDGARCIAATSGDRFVGFLWWQHDRYEEDEVHCLFVLRDAAVSVWDFDVYLEPPFRGGRSLARLWAAADARLVTAGVRWSFSRISLANRASLLAHQRLGAVACSRASFLCLGPLQLAWLQRAPWLHLSLGRWGRPVLSLHAPTSESPRS